MFVRLAISAMSIFQEYFNLEVARISDAFLGCGVWMSPSWAISTNWWNTIGDNLTNCAVDIYTCVGLWIRFGVLSTSRAITIIRFDLSQGVAIIGHTCSSILAEGAIWSAQGSTGSFVTPSQKIISTVSAVISLAASVKGLSISMLVGIASLAGSVDAKIISNIVTKIKAAVLIKDSVNLRISVVWAKVAYLIG
jgi:hypothetical protein